MKCIAVDDEPMALELIKGYVDKTSLLEMAGSFTNPFEALDFLHQNRIELIFLDINMPELSGIQLLKALSYKPGVIFTTAYSQYGAESYEYNAIDYLLKPFTYARFMQAVHKATPNDEELISEARLIDNSGKNVLFIKSGTKTHKVNVDRIRYIEARGNYVYIHEEDKNIISLQSMGDIQAQLPPDEFIRVHKSYIVSIRHIEVIESHQVVISDTEIPVGATYREYFKQVIDGLK